MHIGSSLSRKRDLKGVENLIFKLNLDDLVLNKESWTIPEDNSITLGEDAMLFKNFNLSNGQQSLIIRDDLQGIEKNHVGILFENFRLQALLSYLNPEQALN